ncbi:hypothetical protein [Hylemonella gracilis]|uniref:SnoaL-like domain-containing protein n=1 Tax=Hylemonella gracilis ATCC 19624 TaxID=887062 RepID=F3KUH3_9BURK|nr:hypothetical protein [Hylemonella gracilis]EGI76550.1 hypothetical protein HGR_10535 [Hylemonella gracilis ATCC 19624]
MIHPQQLAERYAALWNEIDPMRRKAAITQLWTANGRHFVKAQQVFGHEALERRVQASHEKNVRDAGCQFRISGDAQQLPGVVTFHWEMVLAATGVVMAAGLEFLALDAEGLIVKDYQFILE